MQDGFIHREYTLSVSRTAQLVFEFPASVSFVGHSADVNSLCPEKLSINLFELAWTPGA